MNRSLSRSLLVLLTGGALALTASTAARTDALTPREQALHVLNRLAFGPRPGEVDRVAQMGVTAYLREQLYPERIPDSRLEGKLSGYSTLTMSNAEVIERFEIPLREAKRKIKAERTASQADDTEPDQAEMKKYREMIPAENRPGRILEELTAARILRASESERQLNEVLVDFWMNHFNVYAKKGEDRFAIISFERDTIRPHIWGKFEDLLQATAKSPAMLFYLDNARSVADPEHRPTGDFSQASLAGRGRFGRRMAGAAADGTNAEMPLRANANAKAPKGLNENYARELMELHTLGVDGGYSQKDVTELARILTGWSIGRTRGMRGEADGASRGRRMGMEETPGGFVFRAAAHDVGGKTFLGTNFSGSGGMEEGERAIAMLARQPATARHIAYQLCQRLVADEPPKELVERVAKRFLATGGDLRETVRVIIESPEFFDPRVLPGQDQVSLRVRRIRASSRRRHDRRARDREGDRGDGRAVVPLPAAHRVRGHRGCLDQLRGAARPLELRCGAGAGKALRNHGGHESAASGGRRVAGSRRRRRGAFAHRHGRLGGDPADDHQTHGRRQRRRGAVDSHDGAHSGKPRISKAVTCSTEESS